MPADFTPTSQFEEHRPHLRAVAYRMLGNVSDAEDAVQEAWLRLARSDSDSVIDLRGWLTTVVGRICLDLLRARRARPEDAAGTTLPEPIVTTDADRGPEESAVLADSVGLALLVVLEALNPEERLAFVLHDVFGEPFESIARVLDRSPAATRQLASRARRRIRDEFPAPQPDRRAQRHIVEAFLRAAQGGDLTGLIEVLHPQVVMRADVGYTGAPTRPPVRGAEAVAEALLVRTPLFARRAVHSYVNGVAGLVVPSPAGVIAAIAFSMTDERIASIDLVLDPDKLTRVPRPS